MHEDTKQQFREWTSTILAVVLAAILTGIGAGISAGVGLGITRLFKKGISNVKHEP